jgi:hypothetical protein
MDYVGVAFGAGTDGGEVAPGEAHFDNVEGDLPQVGWCKASSLTDDFEDGLQGQAWARSYADSGCSLAEIGGELVATLGDGVTSYCAYASAAAYDLTGDAVSIAVLGTPDATMSGQAGLFLGTTAGDAIYFVESAGVLDLGQLVGGTSLSLATVLYSATDHAWWRLRESAGTTYWETSPDGAAWTVRAQAVNPIDVTALDVQLGVSAYEPDAMPGAARFDQYNLP